VRVLFPRGFFKEFVVNFDGTLASSMLSSCTQ
jgi:hypothetical protein